MDYLESDEALARRLQGEELSRREVASPLLRSGARPVQANVAADLSEVHRQSSKVIAILLIVWLAELICTITIVSLNAHKDCDRPLLLWICVFSARLFIIAPLTLRTFWRHRHDLPQEEWTLKTEQTLRLIFFLWFIMGQVWTYSSQHCSETAPSLYIYAIVLISLVYFYTLLPLVILLAICICLPCVLIVLRFIGDSKGASDSIIDKLPLHQYQSNGGEVPTCAICMYEFEQSQEIRTLPCSHDFHQLCVDRWLKLKRECPLCRGDITKESNV